MKCCRALGIFCSLFLTSLVYRHGSTTVISSALEERTGVRMNTEAGQVSVHVEVAQQPACAT